MEDNADIVELDKLAREWCADPHRFFKAFSRTAREFQRSHPSPRLRTMTLVGKPEEFLEKRPLQFHLWGETTRVGSWAQLLSVVTRQVAMSRPRVVEQLDQAGLAPWMVRKNPEDGLLDAFRKGEVTLKLATVAEAFARAQWLLLMAGVNLNEAVVQVDPFTDEQWKARNREIIAKREAENRVLREIDQAREKWAAEHPDGVADGEGAPETDERPAEGGRDGGFVF